MEIDRAELGVSLAEQLRALDRICRAAGTTVASVKAHGALYEEVAKGGAVYETFRDAVRDSVGEDAALVLPSGCRGHGDGAARRRDRRARRDSATAPTAPTAGWSTGRSPARCWPTPGRRRRRRSAWPAARWSPTTGRVLTLWVDTLCIHGDSPGAVAIATAVRRAMADVGIEVVAPARA